MKRASDTILFQSKPTPDTASAGVEPVVMLPADDPWSKNDVKLGLHA